MGRPFEMRGTNVTRRRDSLHDIIKCAKKPVSRRLSIKASGVGAGRKKRGRARERGSVDDLVKLSSSLRAERWEREGEKSALQPRERVREKEEGRAVHDAF